MLKKSKTIFVYFLVLTLMLCCLTGCGKKKGESDGKVKVVCTIFPIYDWTRNILGDNPGNVEITQLIANGVDLHSFQPTAEDIMNVSECDIFIYVGGESDEWAEDALKNATNKNMTVLNLMDLLGDQAKEEELIEGMEGEEEEEEEEEEHTGVEYDEHIWLSLKNAKLLSSEIEKALERADADHADTYQKNLSAYTERLDALDQSYEEAVSAGTKNTLLFGDRFPFRYLTDDYGLKYYAAFIGCSAETEASFETIAFLSEKVDQLGLSTILKIESSDGSIAETIKDNTKSKDQKILTLDSMQSVTTADIKDGADYISIMEENLEVLKEALQ